MALTSSWALACVCCCCCCVYCCCCWPTTSTVVVVVGQRRAEGFTFDSAVSLIHPAPGRLALSAAPAARTLSHAGPESTLSLNPQLPPSGAVGIHSYHRQHEYAFSPRSVRRSRPARHPHPRTLRPLSSFPPFSPQATRATLRSTRIRPRATALTSRASATFTLSAWRRRAARHTLQAQGCVRQPRPGRTTGRRRERKRKRETRRHGASQRRSFQSAENADAFWLQCAVTPAMRPGPSAPALTPPLLLAVRFQPGDRITAVNGQDVTNVSHENLVRLIKTAGNVLRMKVRAMTQVSVEEKGKEEEEERQKERRKGNVHVCTDERTAHCAPAWLRPSFLCAAACCPSLLRSGCNAHCPYE